MNHVNLYELEGTEYPAGRISRVLVGDNGALQGNYFVQGYSIIYPNCGIPEHEHPAEETYFIYSGSGYMVVDGETTDLKAGDLILVQSGKKHRLFNSSDSDMHMMYVYAPKMIVDHWQQELNGELK